MPASTNWRIDSGLDVAGPRVQTIFARRTVSKLADQRLTRAIRTGTRSGSRQDLTHRTHVRSRKRARGGESLPDRPRARRLQPLVQHCNPLALLRNAARAS